MGNQAPAPSVDAESVERLFDDFQSIMRDFRRLRPSAKSVPEGITISEAYLIAMLGKHRKMQKEVTPGMLAAASHLSKSAASQQLRALEDKGLICRTRSSADARAVIVSLSDKGAGFYDRMTLRAKENAVSLVEYVGEEDFRKFIDVLTRIWEFQQQSSDFEEVDSDERGMGPCA